MADNNNKVEFGLSGVHVCGWDDATSKPAAVATPKAILGAVSLTMEDSEESMQFFADNVIYYSEQTAGITSGELTMALFPDWFKVEYLGYVRLDDGGMAQLTNGKKKPFCLVFDGDGDANQTRHVVYNVKAGAIKREYKTIEEKKEVLVEVIPVSIIGDQKIGIKKVRYLPTDAGFASILTKVPDPTLPAAGA